MTGATVGTIAGGLITMGVPEQHAKQLENQLRDGQILLSVHTKSLHTLAEAEKIFKASGALDFFSTQRNVSPTA